MYIQYTRAVAINEKSKEYTKSNFFIAIGRTRKKVSDGGINIRIELERSTTFPIFFVSK